MMAITIKYSEVLFDLQNKNREEVRSIEEPQARYLAEAGSDKIDEVARCIQEAITNVTAMFLRFTSAKENEGASDMLRNPDNVLLEFNVSERRGAGKDEMIADALHSLIVNLSLSKFYSTINQTELMAKRDKLAKSDAAVLNKLLYEKLPPVYPTIEENE